MKNKKKFFKVLGAKLRQARMAAGLKQKELAEKAAVKLATVAKVERGQGTFSLWVLIDLADALGVLLEALLLGTICANGEAKDKVSRTGSIVPVGPLGKNFFEQLGRNIRVARYTTGLTQKQLAKNAGVTVLHVSSIERGSETPSFELIFRLAKATGTSMEDLVRGL